ncbi:Fic family protein [Corynebacterium variabile]|uniref:Fic family protein n=1 Tax=Corynebacterium variabile TaxID=1727 RepID=UPI002FE31C3B
MFRDIAKHPPSTSDVDAAVATVADHWAELTMVHPFRDGNSRTQRFFFDQMLRDAGWPVDWTLVSAEQVHAARYVGAATVDSSYLAQALRPTRNGVWCCIIRVVPVRNRRMPRQPVRHRDLPRHDDLPADASPGRPVPAGIVNRDWQIFDESPADFRSWTDRKSHFRW